MIRSDAYREAATEIRRRAPTQQDDVREIMLKEADHLDKKADTVDVWASLGVLFADFSKGMR